MASDWSKVVIADLGRVVTGRTPSRSSPEYWGEDVPFLTPSDMDGRRSISTTRRYLSAEGKAGLQRALVSHGVGVSCIGWQMGKVVLIESPTITNQQINSVITDSAVVDKLFLYYALATRRDDIFRLGAGGSRTPILKKSLFERLSVTLPPLDEQRRIAAVLGALDDKIELNRKMNRTLEAMAQATFKSWFIDFDGVPDSDLVDSELGPIPKGWTCRPISEVVEAVFDGPHATPKPAESGPMFLGIKNLTGTGLDLGTVRHIAEADWPRWTKRVVPEAGDIVFCYEARLGDFAILPPGLRCCLGRRMALVRPLAEAENRHFLFHQFVGGPFQAFLKRRINPGSTVDRILLKDFPSYPLVMPPASVVARFEALASAIWRNIHNAQAEAATLTNLRNALLPKLISGELRVPESVEVVEATL